MFYIRLLSLLYINIDTNAHNVKFAERVHRLSDKVNAHKSK